MKNIFFIPGAVKPGHLWRGYKALARVFRVAEASLIRSAGPALEYTF